MTQNDTTLLASFDRKLQLIRDRVRGVAERYYTAAYLVGRPGTSKTHTVETELEGLDIPFVLRNARMTPMGLFEFLHDHPEHVVVLDDIASLFKQQAALQILMAALDGDPDQPRTVTYKSKDRDISFEFTGGVVAISNVPLKNDPLANAVASRVVQVEHEPTDEEIAAFMRTLAENGYKELGADECLEVVEFVVSETRNHDRRLDLRHMTKACEDRRQWEHGHARTSWQDLVRTSLNKMMHEPKPSLSKVDEIEEQKRRVKDAMEQFPNDRKKQIEITGLGKSTFYNRRRELLMA